MTATLFVECALRATLIVAAIAVVVRAARITSAAGRHAAFTVAVLAMLVLPVWTIAGPKLSLPVLTTTPVSVPVPASPAAPIAARQVVAPAAAADALDTGQPPARPGLDWLGLFTAVYVVGAFALLTRLAIGTIRARRLQRSARSVAGRRSSPRCVTPITVGWFSPVLILPVHWEQWSGPQLDAVLTHEGAHARRRDPLVQWLALLNRAIFWFHPLAWWLERRLTALAEEACDTAVLAAGHSPQDYSEYLLDLARVVARHGRRVNVVGMAMPGNYLEPRLRRILDGTLQMPASRIRLAWAVVVAAIASGAAVSASLGPRSQAASHAPTNAPRFDVASVKPCDPGAAVPQTGSGRGGGGASQASPVHFQLNCRTLNVLILDAYVTFADGRYSRPSSRPAFDVFHAGPDWIRSEKFTIEATTAGPTPLPMMEGPMLQTLLQDRFDVRLHRETRDVPILELVVGKGGSKLTPFTPGTCVPFDWNVFPPASLDPGQHRCGAGQLMGSDGRYAQTVEAMTLDDWVGSFDSRALLGEPPIVNKTGITGLQTFRFVSPANPEDFAVELKKQLGLELRPARGGRDFLILDRVARPVPDEPVTTQAGTSPHAATSPTFDVVSVKPCDSNAAGAGRGVGSGGVEASPASLHIDCMTPKGLIQTAFLLHADGHGHAPRVLTAITVEGGPDWLAKDRYTIDATAAGAPGNEVMRGPMLQSLLQDRFKLRLHRGTRSTPVYDLVVAKGGSKLKSFTEGACVPYDWSTYPPVPIPAGKRACGSKGQPGEDGRLVTSYEAVSLADVAELFLSRLVDRPVIDRTGIDGLVVLRLDYNIHDGSSVFAAVKEQLGLELRSATGNREFLSVEHIEKPSSNQSLPSAVSKR